MSNSWAIEGLEELAQGRMKSWGFAMPAKDSTKSLKSPWLKKREKEGRKEGKKEEREGGN